VATAADTGLQTTFGPSSRKSGTNLSLGTTWQLTVNWGTSDANQAGMKEAGIFGTALQDAGIMLARTTFAEINKTNNDTLEIQWQINVAGC